MADRAAWPTRGAGPEGTAGVMWRSEAVATMKADRDEPPPRMNPCRPAPGRRPKPMPRPGTRARAGRASSWTHYNDTYNNDDNCENDNDGDNADGRRNATPYPTRPLARTTRCNQ
jgi:hypothetical protein